MGCFSFYHWGKSSFFIIGVLSNEKNWNNKFFFVFGNWAQNLDYSSDLLQFILSKLGRDMLTKQIWIISY